VTAFQIHLTMQFMIFIDYYGIEQISADTSTNKLWYTKKNE